MLDWIDDLFRLQKGDFNITSSNYLLSNHQLNTKLVEYWSPTVLKNRDLVGLVRVSCHYNSINHWS